MTKARIIPGYNPQNRNLIRCPVEHAEEVAVLYPEAQLEYVGTGISSYVEDRLEGIGESDYETIWREFCACKGWGEDISKLGMRYLKNAR